MGVRRRIGLLALGGIIVLGSIAGCAMLDNSLNNIRGALIGQAFDMEFYDDYGNNTMDIKGSKITIGVVTNSVTSKTSDGTTETKEEQTSVLDMTINGKQMYQVGNTMVALEEGLEMIDGADIPSSITSNSGGGFVPFDRKINNIKNMLGTGKIVVISSQQGVPIGVIKGQDVYFEVPKNLPKMTRLVVDGKSCYIHRANYLILDSSLIE